MRLSCEELEIIYLVFNQYMEDWIESMDESILENELFLEYNNIFKKIIKALYYKRRKKINE